MESQIGVGYRQVQGTAAAATDTHDAGHPFTFAARKHAIRAKCVLSAEHDGNLHLQHACVHGTAYAHAYAPQDKVCKHIVLMLRTDMPWL